jgi:hypothetical protein
MILSTVNRKTNTGDPVVKEIVFLGDNGSSTKSGR